MQDQATLNVGLPVGGNGDVPVPYAFESLLQQMGAGDTPPDPSQPPPGQPSPAQDSVSSQAGAEAPAPVASSTWSGAQSLPRSVHPLPRLDVSSVAIYSQTPGASLAATSDATLSPSRPGTQTAIPQSPATQTATTQPSSSGAALTLPSNETIPPEGTPPQAANAATFPALPAPSAKSTSSFTLRTSSDGRPAAKVSHTPRSTALAQDALPTSVTALLIDLNQRQVDVSHAGPSSFAEASAEASTPAFSTTDQQSPTSATPLASTSVSATGNANTSDGSNGVVPAPLPPYASFGATPQPMEAPASRADLTNAPPPTLPTPATFSNTDQGTQPSPVFHAGGSSTRSTNSASVSAVTTATATTSTDSVLSNTLPTVQQPPRMQPTEAPKPQTSAAAAKSQPVVSASAARTQAKDEPPLAVTATPTVQAPTQEQRPTTNVPSFGPSVSASAPHTGVAQDILSTKTQPPADASSATSAPGTAASAPAVTVPSVGPVNASAGHSAAPAIASTAIHSPAEVATSATGLPSERSGPPLASSGALREASAPPRAEVPDPPSPTLTHARLMQTMGGSQMQVNLSTEEFGHVSVRAGYSRDALTAQITLDNPQLGTAISAHLPGAEQKLAGDHGLRTAITVTRSTANPDLGGGQSGSNHRQGSAPHSANSARNGSFSRSPLTGADSDGLSASTPTPTPATSGRLNIRI